MSATPSSLSPITLTAIEPIDCYTPRFAKDQIVLAIPPEEPDTIRIHQLDAENQLLLIGNTIDDPVYLRQYLERALEVPRTSPFCGTPGGPRAIPRAQLCYTTSGEPYTYSKTQHDTAPYPPHVIEIIQKLLSRLQTASPDQPYRTPDTATDLLYSALQKNGGSISAHSDDENPKWGLVLIYSLGQSRYLRIRAKDKQSPFVNLKLSHNTIAAMLGPSLQARYTHQIDKLKDGTTIGARLSLNVRFVADPADIL